MTRRVLRILVEVEGEAFDPDAANPYAETQAELEAVLNSNLPTITSMDAGDVITLRDTNGQKCGKVECEDFPGSSPILPYWTKLADFALDVAEEFPVRAFIQGAIEKVQGQTERKSVQYAAEPGGQKTDNPEPTLLVNEEVNAAAAAAAAAFDAGEVAEIPHSERLSSHEHIAVAGPSEPRLDLGPRRRKSTGNPDVPPPPGDPSLM